MLLTGVLESIRNWNNKEYSMVVQALKIRPGSDHIRRDGGGQVSGDS